MSSALVQTIQENPKANAGVGINVFIPMTKEQADARKKNFIKGLKLNMFKLEQRAKFVS